MVCDVDTAGLTPSLPAAVCCSSAHGPAGVWVDVPWVADAVGAHHLVVLVLKQVAAQCSSSNVTRGKAAAVWWHTQAAPYAVHACI
jgi:hypothetical protein